MLEEDFCFTDRVRITRKDIRELQLAKGAVCAGLKTICASRGLSPSQIDRIYLAGAFGNYLDVDSACRIGLLPKASKGKVRALGNAAGRGACLAALGEASFAEFERFARATEHINLASSTFLQSLNLEPLV